MKKLFLILVFAFVSELVCAQKVLGTNQFDMVKIMSDRGYTYLKTQLYDPYIIDYEAYRMNENDEETVCYFNCQELCYQYRIVLTPTHINGVIKILNRSMVKVGKDKWKDKDRITAVTYVPPGNGRTLPSLIYRSLLIDE